MEVTWEVGTDGSIYAVQSEPYQFARDWKVEQEIKDDKQRREVEESVGSKSGNNEGPGKRNCYVPIRDA